ncbi:MAG TPA: iron-sulfur cluster assembly scaffold protein [Planctomycetota bacterium]
MVSEGLRQVLLAGEGVGELAGPGTGQGVADHPVCGDRVQLSVQHEAGTIRAVRWRAAGCPASMAVAALCAKVLVDVPVAQAPSALRSAIAAHGGLAAHERHAEGMVLRALAAAVAK